MGLFAHMCACDGFRLLTSPARRVRQGLLDSWNEVIALGSECEAARFTAAQLHSATQVFQMMLSESMERRDERTKREDGDEMDEEEQDQLADEIEREEILVQNIVECIGALLKVYSSSLLPLFDQLLLPAFQAMLQPTAIATDRVAALCVFDDIIEHCSADGGSARYVPVLLPAFITYAADEATEVRQAAVYGLGVLAEHGSAAAFDDAAQQQAGARLLQVIEAPDAFNEDNASASDNAVSALGKLCRRSDAIGAAAMQRWLQKLPLRADKEEARSVHRMLVELCEATNVHLLGPQNERLPQIIVIFGQVLGTELIDDETRQRIGNLLKQIRSGLPHVLQALPSHQGFASLSAEQRAALEQAISS